MRHAPPLAAGLPAPRGAEDALAGPEPVVLIGCGASKAAAATLAGELYLGPYFQACRAAAAAITPPRRVLIMSAWYGLLGLADGPLPPYDVTIGQPGSVTAARLREQAEARGVAAEPVIALCGSRYTGLAAQVWDTVITPLAGLGIGRQRQLLIAAAAAGTPAASRRVLAARAAAHTAPARRGRGEALRRRIA